MKLLKQILLITPILFIFVTSGCSKNLLHPSDPEPFQPKEEIVGEVDTSSGLDEKPGSGPEVGSAEQGMTGDDSTSAVSAEPFIEDSGEDTPSRLYEKPDPRKFGSAEQGMPGDGATGSFSAEPFTGSIPEPDSEFFREESVAEVDTHSPRYGHIPDQGNARFRSR